MKLGDYVRTPNGVIAKIIDIQDEEGQYFVNNNVVSLKSKTYIADKNITIGESFKHSPNIIDLVQRGDFINGDQISKVEVSDIDEIKRAFNCEYDTGCYTNEMIKSVVTKEQFESVEYKVGE